MEQDLRRHLHTLAEAYAAHRRMTLTTVGRLAAGDWRFFSRIGDGASFTARKYDEIVAWFAKNWPADAAWPEDVPRPEPIEAAA
jgi:hypothetical protein